MFEVFTPRNGNRPTVVGIYYLLMPFFDEIKVSCILLYESGSVTVVSAFHLSSYSTSTEATPLQNVDKNSGKAKYQTDTF